MFSMSQSHYDNLTRLNPIKQSFKHMYIKKILTILD